MSKRDVQKPIGKKIYRVKDLNSLPVDDNGELQIPKDGILMGPDDKWWIDAEGNAYFGGEMTVLKDVDPQYVQLDNQTSSISVPNRSAFVHNQVLKYKNSAGSLETTPLGAASAGHPTAITSVTNHTDPGTLCPTSFGTDTEQVTISPSSTSAKIFVMAFFFGSDETGGDIPGVRITRGTSTALATWSAATTANTVPSYWGGMIAHIDSPGTISSTNYELQFDGDGSERILHSSLMCWECLEGGA